MRRRSRTPRFNEMRLNIQNRVAQRLAFLDLEVEKI